MKISKPTPPKSRLENRKGILSRLFGLLFGRKKSKGYRKGTELDPDCYDENCDLIPEMLDSTPYINERGSGGLIGHRNPPPPPPPERESQFSINQREYHKTHRDFMNK